MIRLSLWSPKKPRRNPRQHLAGAVSLRAPRAEVTLERNDFREMPLRVPWAAGGCAVGRAAKGGWLMVRCSLWASKTVTVFEILSYMRYNIPHDSKKSKTLEI